LNTCNQSLSVAWQDDKDWLVVLILLPDFAPEEHRLAYLNWVGRAAAFAWYTDTRLVAQIGDPDMPCYELWFSFPNERCKQQFFDLVREDGFMNPDGKGDNADFRPPASDDYWQELQGLQPVARVFPEKNVELITGVMYITMNELKQRPAQRQDSIERKPN